MIGGQRHGCDYSRHKSPKELSWGTRGSVGLREGNTLGWSDGPYSQEPGIEGALAPIREAPRKQGLFGGRKLLPLYLKTPRRNEWNIVVFSLDVSAYIRLFVFSHLATAEAIN